MRLQSNAHCHTQCARTQCSESHYFTSAASSSPAKNFGKTICNLVQLVMCYESLQDNIINGLIVIKYYVYAPYVLQPIIILIIVPIIKNKSVCLPSVDFNWFIALVTCLVVSST